MKALLAILGISVVALAAWTPGNESAASQRRAGGMKGSRNGLDPNSPLAKSIAKSHELRARAAEKWRNGDLEEARSLLMEADKALPNNIVTLYSLGEISNRMGDANAAVRYFRRAFDPDDEAGSTFEEDPIALWEYAKAAEAVDQAEAEAVYKRMASVGVDTIGPNYPRLGGDLPARASAHARLGLQLWKKDRYAEAAAELNKAAGHAPRDPAIAFYRALALVEVGDKTGAKRALGLVKSIGGNRVSKTAFDYVQARADQR
jgi:tetratricopeptide (TPR) repeat protein